MNRAPDALGGGRHLDVADAERRKCVNQRVADRWQGANITGFAGALDTERVFYRNWVYVGRAELVARPGAWIRVEIAGESILVVRGKDEKIRGFYNVCRHRGSRICDDEQGEVRTHLRCPYHAWGYALDGTLVTTPMIEKDEIDRESTSLWPVHVDVWEGFVFVNLAEHPRPLEDVLRPLLGRFAPWRLRELVSARRIVYDVRSNWKLIFQNFSECYHCPPVHPALAKLSHYRSGANNLREGGILGGYMLINEKGGSLTVSGRLCGAPLRHTFVDLGMSPLCETFLAADELDRMEPFYPLHVLICGECLLVQLQAYVDASEIFREYAYKQGETTVTTTPFDVYAERRGVCQDFTNLFICLARLLGVPARYMCGYIYTGPKEQRHVQSEASHAWVQVYLPGAGWIEFDPTNGLIGGNNLIRVGVARDPRQAIPLQGSYEGAAADFVDMTVEVTVSKLS